MPIVDEAEQLELWKLSQFSGMGFDGASVSALLEWNVSPHDVRELLFRDGERTACTHDVALRIVQPLEVLAAKPETKSIKLCAVCNGGRCDGEFCPAA